MSDKLSSEELLKVLEELARKGEVLIRKSPLLDGGINVIWNAGSSKSAGHISATLDEAIIAVNDELKKRDEKE
jgi:hypothetical protein